MTSPEPYPIPPELGQLLVLRGVRRGRVVLVGRDLLIDHGWRVPDYIRAPLHELLDDGHLYLALNGWNGAISRTTRSPCRTWPGSPTPSLDSMIPA